MVAETVWFAAGCCAGLDMLSAVVLRPCRQSRAGHRLRLLRSIIRTSSSRTTFQRRQGKAKPKRVAEQAVTLFWRERPSKPSLTTCGTPGTRRRSAVARRRQADDAFSRSPRRGPDSEQAKRRRNRRGGARPPRAEQRSVLENQNPVGQHLCGCHVKSSGGVVRSQHTWRR